MSYCRFSSDNFGCDLYCYEDYMGGWTTHVAGNRVVGDIPKVPDIREAETTEWLTAHRAQMEFLETCKREKITLPHAGERFSDDDLESFLSRLLYLRGLGYRFPDYVIDEVKEEMEAK